MPKLLKVCIFALRCYNNIFKILNFCYKDTRLHDIMKKCGAAGKSSEIGKNCENSNFDISNYYIDEEKYLCEASFKVTCMDENEKVQCSNGQISAKVNSNCDDNESEAFKVVKSFIFIKI